MALRQSGHGGGMRLSYDDGKGESDVAGISVTGGWNRRGLDAESFGDWEGSFS